jgi:hypothetical protein
MAPPVIRNLRPDRILVMARGRLSGAAFLPLVRDCLVATHPNLPSQLA